MAIKGCIGVLSRSIMPGTVCGMVHGCLLGRLLTFELHTQNLSCMLVVPAMPKDAFRFTDQDDVKMYHLSQLGIVRFAAFQTVRT